MDGFLFSTVIVNNTASINDFVEQWSRIYNYPDTEVYERIILKSQLAKDDIIEVFRWKNRIPLSDKKKKAIEEKLCSKIDIINQLKQEWNRSLFEEHFDSLGTIWKVFLMHIINPNELPIFDQHVYRAYKHIAEHEKYGKFKAGNNLKLELYDQKYLPFYLKMKEQMSSEFSNKQLDDALWAFGKFLNNYNGLVL